MSGTRPFHALRLAPCRFTPHVWHSAVSHPTSSTRPFPALRLVPKPQGPCIWRAAAG